MWDFSSVIIIISKIALLDINFGLHFENASFWNLSSGYEHIPIEIL